MEVRVRNIGTAATEAATEIALFLRTAAGSPLDAKAEPAAQSHPIPRLAAGERVDLLFEIPVPAGHDFVSLVVDPGDLITESTEFGHDHANNNVQWERLRFPMRNYRSIGARRRILDAGDGLWRQATGTAGSVTVRFEGAARLPGNVGRGDRLVLAPGGANEVVGYIASRDGPARVTLSFSTTPSPCTHTSVLQVPRSIPISTLNMPIIESKITVRVPS